MLLVCLSTIRRLLEKCHLSRVLAGLVRDPTRHTFPREIVEKAIKRPLLEWQQVIQISALILLLLLRRRHSVLGS